MALWQNKVPRFGKGRLLKSEALDRIRDYPRDYLEIMGADQSDGIVTGFVIEQKEGQIIVGKGVLRHLGRCYILEEPCAIGRGEYNCIQQVVFKIDPVYEETEFIIYPFEILLCGLRELKQSEYELGRFCLQEGAVLRGSCEYKDFKDLTTQFNTVDLLAVRMSGTKVPTLHPIICKMFAAQLQEFSAQDVNDELFMILCMNSRLMERDVILHYLKKKSKNQFRNGQEADNRSIYMHLLRIIELARGKSGEPAGFGGTGRSIID